MSRPPDCLSGSSFGQLAAGMPFVGVTNYSGSVARRKGGFRFWIDYQCLSSPESAALLEQALKQAGGYRTGGPPKICEATGAVLKERDYGHMHLDEWDLLWSISAKAMVTAEVLRPGQMISIIPGLLSITRKTSLVSSLRALLGDEAAFAIIPRTFKLPDELDEWAAWLAGHATVTNPNTASPSPGPCTATTPSPVSSPLVGRDALPLTAATLAGQPAAVPADTGAWILKNNRQRGTGLRVVRTADALGAAYEYEVGGRRDMPPTAVMYRWYLAQQYVADPLLVSGRKFGVRAWVLVPGAQPVLRAYLHTNALVLLAEAKYDTADIRRWDGSAAGGRGREVPAAPSGHITNAFQNADGEAWPFSQLAVHIGADALAELWGRMARSAAAAVAAALPRVRQMHAQLLLPAGSCFQLLGLDFVVDQALRPWLLEVNATPSMSTAHRDPATSAMLRSIKGPVIHDMVRLVGICPERFARMAGGKAPEARRHGGTTDMHEVDAEMQRRGGFMPLTHLFPAGCQ